MIDFKRAFDKVDHTILCEKLQDIGVDGCYLKWIVNFLSDRKQNVKYNGSQSAEIEVQSGVIQGSCIGPVAFTIYINDLCQFIKHAKPSLFADDFKMAGDVSTPVSRELMQQDVVAVARWSVVNKLPISYEKSMTLYFGKGNVRTQYLMNSKVIASGKGCMDLRIYRSDTASYEPHARSVAPKASRLAGIVFKIFSTREPDFLKRLFVAYVRPTLEYAVAVWSPASVAVRNLIERVQRWYT